VNRDRRQEFVEVEWQQGRLLYTRGVARWPSQMQAEAQAQEARGLFAHFSSMDEGRSRVRLFTFDTSEECASEVATHNKWLRDKTTVAKEPTE
jgi:hypothetical protein